jgi:hypothetical protein
MFDRIASNVTVTVASIAFAVLNLVVVLPIVAVLDVEPASDPVE